MRNIQWLCAAVVAAASGMTQASWPPQVIIFTDTCELFYSIQYTPPPVGQVGGWYTATFDTTSCWYPGHSPASGPETKNLLGFNGKGAVLTAYHPLTGGLAVFTVNKDKTYTIKDMAGNTVRSGTWF